MTVDIQESLLVKLYGVLTDDATLASYMGGTVRLYPVWAPPDATFPYLVHRIDMSRVADWWPIVRCTYLLDIWSYSPSAEEALDIRMRIMSLLDNLESSTDETTEFWLWRQTDGFIPETEENIWHYACQFSLKWLKDSEIGVPLKR
jgi:hypothetical protein